MNPTKIVQGILAATLVVWLFCIGLVVGTKKARTDLQKTPPAQQPGYTAVYQTVVYSVPDITQPTVAPVQTSAADIQTTAVQPQQTEPSQTDVPSAEAPTEQTEAPAAPTEITDLAEVVKLYNDAVNKTKTIQNFSLTREDTLNMSIDDVTGGTVVKNFANTFASSKSPHEIESLVFVNGVDTNGSGETPMNALPPITGQAALTAPALLSASAVPNEQGGYNISMALAEEVQTLTAPAAAHSSSMEVIDLAALGLPSIISITELNIYYSGATINAVTDSDGKILTMTHHLPVSHAEGTGKALGISASMKLSGDFTCVYTVTY